MFQTVKNKNAGTILLIETENIVPNKNQPRELFEFEDIQTLAQSIRRNGIIQPLTVRKKGNIYELIAGERRLRASKSIGLREVPCIVMDADDCSSAVYALIENIQRKDLSFVEEGKSIKKLMSFYGMKQEEIAITLGRTPSSVSNLLRILKLSPEILEKIETNGLSQRHARAILRLGSDKQNEIVDKIISKGLTVKQTETLVEELLCEVPKERKKPKLYIRDVRLFLNTINHAVDTMKSAGLDASVRKNETDEAYEFYIKVPKRKSELEKNA